ncbi:MAG: hypothetical protein LBQ96_02785 [Fusobacteriaceae bacterium]|jgi:autotransporter-associated beta strand protein|nr:hypothetical protein [Fusobacteriaceae bacterium]
MNAMGDKRGFFEHWGKARIIIVLILLIFLRALPLGASNIIDVGNSSVASGDGWSYSGGVFTITGNGEYVITGQTNENRVVVQSGVTATVKLDNATVDMSGQAGASALDVAGANVTLVLSGDNQLLASGTAAGLRAPDGTTLIITSADGDGAESGSLLAANAGSSPGSGAGIGGSGGSGNNDGESGGIITINGGSITAKGYYDGVTDFSNPGAGIGGGGWSGDANSLSKAGDGGTITINGGKVTAVGGSSQTSGGEGAAGIGGGSGELYTDHNDAAINAGGSGGTITINGGTIVTCSQINGAGIGGGYRGDSGLIIINGGHITATGGAKGTGIGAGMRGDNNEITITGGVVIAYGGELTATVAQGNYRPTAIGGSTGEPGTITISGGTIVAIGSDGYYAIGSTNPTGEGQIIITGGTIITSGTIGFGENGSIMPVNMPYGNPILMVLSRNGIGITGQPNTDNDQIMVGTLYNWDFSNVEPNVNFYGDVLVDVERKAITLYEDITIPDDAVFSLPSGWILNAAGHLTLTKGGILGFDLHDIEAGSPDVSLRIAGALNGKIGNGSIYIWNFKGNEGYYILAQADDAEYLANPEKFYLEGKLIDNKRSSTKGDMLFATRIWKAADSNYLEGTEGQLVLQAADATKNTKVTWNSKTGSGMWDTSSEYWAGNVDGIPVNTFLNGDDVVFDTPAQVTVGPHDVTANSIDVKANTTLTGKNVHASNGFRVREGANLSIGSGTADGSVSGDIANSGNLTFYPSISDINYVNTISGTGTLTKKGAKTLTLKGINTYSGDTNILEGAVTLPEHYELTASNINISEGAALNLYGTAGKNVNLNPGGLMNIYKGSRIGGNLYANNGTMNFYVPGGETPEQIGAMLTVGGEADISESTVNVAISGAYSPLEPGDEIVLIDAKKRTGAPSNSESKGTAKGLQGVTLEYTFDLVTRDEQLLAVLPGGTGNGDDDGDGDGDGDGNGSDDGDGNGDGNDDGNGNGDGEKPVGEVPRDSSKPTLNPRTKALTDGYLAGLGLVNQGNELIGAALPEEKDPNGNIFAHFGGGALRYHTERDKSAHFDMKSYTVLAGGTKGFDASENKARAGAFIEYGHGSYSTSDTFLNLDSVHGKGNAKYIGGGILGRIDFPERIDRHFYARGAIRAGRIQNRYDSKDLLDGLGNAAKFDSASPYYGANVGFGHLVRDEFNELDLMAKYFYTRVQGDTVRLSTGDPVTFDPMNSHRFHLGMKFTHNYNVFVASYVAITYEHEWDGKASATTNGYKIGTPNLTGATGIGELGLVWSPADESAFSLDLGLQGYRGRRDGASGTLKMKYQF